MNLFDAMSTGLRGMTTGGGLVGNGGTSLGDMFSENLRAAQARAACAQAGGNNQGMRNRPSASGDLLGIAGGAGQTMCDENPVGAMLGMMAGKEIYGANAAVVNSGVQVVGTLLNVVNEP